MKTKQEIIKHNFPFPLHIDQSYSLPIKSHLHRKTRRDSATSRSVNNLHRILDVVIVCSIGPDLEPLDFRV